MFVAAYTAAALLHERDQVMASFFKIEFIVCSLSLSLSLCISTSVFYSGLFPRVFYAIHSSTVFITFFFSFVSQHP